jgi:hypothetical protein
VSPIDRGRAFYECACCTGIDCSWEKLTLVEQEAWVRASLAYEERRRSLSKAVIRRQHHEDSGCEWLTVHVDERDSSEGFSVDEDSAVEACCRLFTDKVERENFIETPDHLGNDAEGESLRWYEWEKEDEGICDRCPDHERKRLAFADVGPGEMESLCLPCYVKAHKEACGCDAWAKAEEQTGVRLIAKLRAALAAPYEGLSLRMMAYERAIKEALTDGDAFTAAVKAMRQHQVAYFKTRSPDELQASKKAEREVDRMLAELEPKAQGRLF